MSRRFFIILMLFVFPISLVPPSLAESNVNVSLTETGGGLLGESFQTDLATGAATASVPIWVPPGRKNLQPALLLSYSSNNSNGICGVGWTIPSNSIQRSTKRGIPKFNAEDSFIFASGGSSAELIEASQGEYRARIEGAFMKYTFAGDRWVVFDKSGAQYTFGSRSASRLENGSKVFAWHLDKVKDVYGNYILYTYEKSSDGEIYLAQIEYTGFEGPGGEGIQPDKKIILNYEPRPDMIQGYRTSWRIKTSKRLSSINVLVNDKLIWRYKLDYKISPDTDRSLLSSITVFDKDGRSLSPKQFTYEELN